MLIEKNNVCLIIFNMQKDFIPSLVEGQKLIDNCCWLIELAKCFDIPTIVLDHKNLGVSLNAVKKTINYNNYLIINTFSCWQDQRVVQMLQKTSKKQFLLAGAETHVSILQSAIDLKANNLDVFMIVDAVSARNEIDHTLAVKRLNNFNIAAISKEMLFFELIRYSEYPNYLDMSLKFLDNRYIRD